MWKALWKTQGGLRRVTTVLFLAVCACASDKTGQGAQLIEQAKAKNDIHALPSFQIKASVRLENYGHPIDGTYALLWNGTDQWREEMSFRGYNEISVGRKDTIAVKRTTDFMPWHISLLHDTLNYGANLSVGEKEKIQRVYGQEINGKKASCVEITGRNSLSRQICVDPSNGALLRNLPFIDENPTALGPKWFPLSLKYVKRETTLAEVKVTELTTPAQFPASAFDPPPGAVSTPRCDPAKIHTGQLIDRVNPQYPPAERLNRVQGTVELYGVVGTDGGIHGLEVVTGVDKAIDQSALDAVRHWRYEPYICNGVPIEVETSVQVNYSLGH
jgi:TonB family protein